jgi:hypothetical protein
VSGFPDVPTWPLLALAIVGAALVIVSVIARVVFTSWDSKDWE